MSLILTPDLSQLPKKLEKPKRMLELSKLPDGRDLICINFSSLSLINECLRKAEYSLIRKLRNETEAEALTFGKAIHKALEHWYSLPVQNRQLTDVENEMAELLIGSPLKEPSLPYETALDSINEFVLAAQPLQWLANEDKRSIKSGIKILKAYFKHYLDDGLEAVRDENGEPYLERMVEFKIFEDDKKVIRFHGQIDIILKSSISGQLLPGDHKTVAQLGAQFYNKIKPNHQYTGYSWAANEVLGLDTDNFLVNALQVAKTKCEFARQTTQRSQEDYDELTMAMVEAVERILKAIELNKFPMNTTQCSSYGQCQYLEVCSAPKKMRETILQGKYQNVI